MKRVLVVASGPDQQCRAAAEAGLGRLLLSKGFQVAPAADVAGPGAFDVDRPDPAVTRDLSTIGVVPRGGNLDPGKIAAWATRNAVDLAVVEIVSRTRCEDYGMPGCTTVTAGAHAVRTRPDAPVWSARALRRTSNPSTTGP